MDPHEIYIGPTEPEARNGAALVLTHLVLGLGPYHQPRLRTIENIFSNIYTLCGR